MSTIGIEISVGKVEARCECGHLWEPEERDEACPACGNGADVDERAWESCQIIADGCAGLQEELGRIDEVERRKIAARLRSLKPGESILASDALDRSTGSEKKHH